MDRTIRMDNTEIQHHQWKLEAYRDEAYQFLIRAQEEARTFDCDDPQDLGDCCVTSCFREFLFQQSSQKRQLLQLIEDALRRIDNETFGECIDCGGRINKKRLEAMPWIQYCLQCQKKLEQVEKVELRESHPLESMHAAK